MGGEQLRAPRQPAPIGAEAGPSRFLAVEVKRPAWLTSGEAGPVAVDAAHESGTWPKLPQSGDECPRVALEWGVQTAATSQAPPSPPCRKGMPPCPRGAWPLLWRWGLHTRSDCRWRPPTERDAGRLVGRPGRALTGYAGRCNTGSSLAISIGSSVIASSST